MTALLLSALLLGAVAGYVARELYARHREARRRRYLIAQIGDTEAAIEQARNCQCEECAAKRRERETRVS